MAMNIKNPEVEQLVEEVVELTGESKTEAVRRALQERKERLSFRVAPRRRGESFLEFLKEEIWPNIPESELGRRLTKEEKEEILGYGPEGV
ncbi:MAG: type II toxin-antitoxin system VapB family antitoxin [Thermoanaerobaculia bacterium]